MGRARLIAFEARLITPAMKNVVADIQPFDDPVPPVARDLDLITFLFFYHDTTYGLDGCLFAVVSDLPSIPGLHVNYGETALPVRDGLMKLKDFPKGFGGILWDLCAALGRNLRRIHSWWYPTNAQLRVHLANRSATGLILT